MASDETLVGRIRDVVADTVGVTERTMFGGICFFLNGNILVGAWNDALIARVGPNAAGKALSKPHVRIMDITGKPMRGWLIIEPPGIDTDRQLKTWIKQAVTFVSTLPSK